MAKLSTLCGFTKGVSVDVFEYNPPKVQSRSDV